MQMLEWNTQKARSIHSAKRALLPFYHRREAKQRMLCPGTDSIERIRKEEADLGMTQKIEQQQDEQQQEEEQQALPKGHQHSPNDLHLQSKEGSQQGRCHDHNER